MTKGVECTLEQHVIINCINKHEKALVRDNTTPPFVIPTGIAKELADTMQVWTLNESACPPVIRQLPDRTLHLHNVDFYIWLKKISPKEDSKVFKLQFWKLFALNDWFSHKGSVCCYSLSKHIYSDAEEAEQESGASEIGHCRTVHICVGTCQSLM